ALAGVEPDGSCHPRHTVVAIVSVLDGSAGVQRPTFSSRPLRVPVGLHDVHGTPTVFTDRPWRLNFAGSAPVTVISRGKRRHGRGELVQDRGEVGSALAVALERDSPSNLALEVGYG